MLLQQLKKFLFMGALLTASVNTFAELQAITGAISPANGDLLDGQNFDLVIHAPGLNLPTNAPSGFLSDNLIVSAFIDDLDVSPWLKSCLKPVLPAEPGSTTAAFICKGQSGSVFKTSGLHRLDVKLAFINGPVVYAKADYRLIKSSPSLIAPVEFTVQSNKPLNPTTLFVTSYDRLQLRASGWVSTWPSNGVRLAGPRGPNVTCSSICLVPYAPPGALVVKVGTTGRWIPVGEYLDLYVDAPGELIFAVNDNNSSPLNWSDNVGIFQVVINRLP